MIFSEVFNCELKLCFELTLILVKVVMTLLITAVKRDCDGYFRSSKSSVRISPEGLVKSVSSKDFFGYSKFSNDLVETNSEDAQPARNIKTVKVNTFAISIISSSL